VVAHVTQANSSASRNVHVRGSLTNSRIRFEREKKGHVAFMGGSITEMNGYRPMVSRLLKQRFPNTEFTFTNAGIASTCSTTGAFRLQSDLLSKGPVDLVLIEFAVNDDQDAGHSRIECIRGLEGIFRQARRYNPKMDIVLIYFVNPTILESLKAGQTPRSIASHDEVARYYNISTVHLAQEIADRVTQGTLTWKQFGGTHPGRFGNEIATSLVSQLLSKAWTNPLAENASQVPHPFPVVPIDSFHYGRGHFLNPSKASFSEAWQFHKPDWKDIPGAKRDRFVNIPMLCTQEPGSELALSFTGTAVGAYIVAGPDAGIAETSIDGSPWESTNLFHRHSRGLHYPRTVMFATQLKNREHTLKLRMKQDTTSAGHAMRIMWFVVNGK